MLPVLIELAGAPLGKGRPRFSRATGHAFTPEKTRRYDSHLRFVAQEIMGDLPPVECPLEVQVLAAMPVPASWSKKKRDDALNGFIRPTSKPDCDNILKMLDALNEVVWRDDKQIVSATIRKVYSERPCLRILVKEADAIDQLFCPKDHNQKVPTRCRNSPGTTTRIANSCSIRPMA